MMAVFICALLAGQVARVSGTNTAEYHLKVAEAYVQKHNYDQAIPELRLALKLKSDSKEAEGMLGEALLAQGYIGEAIPHLERAQRLDLLGIALAEDHHTAQAIQTLLAALAKEPNNPDLLFYLGKACGFLSKSSFGRLVDVAPNSARAHQLMGESYNAQQKFDLAEREYRKALELQPDLHGVHLELGRMKQGAGDLEAAEVEFRVEAKLSPGDGEVAWRLGSVLLSEEHTQEALKQLQRSDELRPEMIETLYDLGKALEQENQLPAAEKAWLQLIKLGPHTPLAVSAHLELSHLYRREGRAAEADSQLQQFREMSKTKPAD